MLIAAMTLGILVGVGEVFGGAAGWIQGAHSYYDGVEWWVVAIIPFGVIAAAGGFCTLRKPDFAAAPTAPVRYWEFCGGFNRSSRLFRSIKSISPHRIISFSRCFRPI